MSKPMLLEPLTVTYEVPRDELIRIWWRRRFFRPQRVGTMTGQTIVAILCILLGKPLLYAGLLLLFFLIISPYVHYEAVARAVKGRPETTARRTVEFTADRVTVTGPDWKSEMAWSRFRGFSEDEKYFYLHLSDDGIDSVIPKSAFTPDAQVKFREHAKSLFAVPREAPDKMRS